MTKVKLAEEVVDPDDIEMLEDLIVAATNEALRKVEQENQAVMSKLTGGLGGLGGGFHSDGILQQSYQQADRAAFPSSGNGEKSAQRLAFHIMNMPKEQVEQLTNAITDARRTYGTVRMLLHPYG